MNKQTKQSILYITSVILIYVFIGILEFFVGPVIVDIITTNMWIHILIFIICLIIINPIITAIISNKVPYKAIGLNKVEKPKNKTKIIEESIDNKQVTKRRSRRNKDQH